MFQAIARQKARQEEEIAAKKHAGKYTASWAELNNPTGKPVTEEDIADALLKRVQWAERFAQTLGPSIDARMVASQALGVDLSDNTRQQIERGSSGVQALTLWLASPEFQRR